LGLFFRTRLRRPNATPPRPTTRRRSLTQLAEIDQRGLDVKREPYARFARIESILLEHSRILAEHVRILEALPETISRKIGFQPAEQA